MAEETGIEFLIKISGLLSRYSIINEDVFQDSCKFHNMLFDYLYQDPRKPKTLEVAFELTRQDGKHKGSLKRLRERVRDKYIRMAFYFCEGETFSSKAECLETEICAFKESGTIQRWSHDQEIMYKEIDANEIWKYLYNASLAAGGGLSTSVTKELLPTGLKKIKQIVNNLDDYIMACEPLFLEGEKADAVKLYGRRDAMNRYKISKAVTLHIPKNK